MSAASSSTSSTVASIADLVAQGKAARTNKDLSKALECFEQALKQAEEVHGELAEETAPLYVLYGQVLFEIAVAQSDMFGQAVHDAHDDAAAAESDDAEEDEEAEGDEEEEEERDE